MKINEIYIKGFGKLKDFTLKLCDGMNVIFGGNEDGKTTVTAFIKAMFYGTGPKLKSIENSPRIRYKPWDGSPMGGRIYFESCGKNYCLEREFRGSDSTDRILLTDCDSGVSENAASDIGTRFFGINAEAFEKSLMIGSAVTGISAAAAGELNSKLSNLALTGDESSSFKSVSDRIISASEKLISKSGRTGSCIKSREKLRALEEEFAKAENDAQRKFEISAELSSAKEESYAANKRLKAVKKLISGKNDAQKKLKLERYLSEKEELEELKSKYTAPDGRPIDIKSVEFCLSKAKNAIESSNFYRLDAEKIAKEIELSQNFDLEKGSEELKNLKESIDSLSSQSNALDSQIACKKREKENLNLSLEAAKNAKKPFNAPLLFAGLLTAIFSVIIFFISKSVILSAACAAAGLISALLSLIIRPADKSRYMAAESSLASISGDIASLCAEKNSITAKITELNSRISLINSAISTDTALKERRETELKEKLENAEKFEREKELAMDALGKIIGNYCDIKSEESVRNATEEIRKNSEKIMQIKTDLKYLSDDLEGISYDEAKEKLKTLYNGSPAENIDYEAAEREKERLEALLMSLSAKQAEKETELKTGFRNYKSPETVSREIAILKEDIASKEEFCEAARLANDILCESFAEIRKGYGSAVEAETLKIFSQLTNGRYGLINISKELEMSVERSDIFGMHEIAYLSKGTADQAYLSLRLAISKLISNTEPLPVIMDDVLSQYDDGRTASALNFLKEYSKQTQTVLFTCHGFIAQAAERSDITVKTLF